MKLKRGFFITFEGPDGSGKTTQAEKLFLYLEERGYPRLKTREPGGTELSEKLRGILLNPKNHIFPWTELFIYGASRAQHTEEVILPALRDCKIVLCERYSDATLAYQGYGRGLDLEKVKEINRIASHGSEPDLTLLLDVDIREGLKRRGLGELDRLEKEDISFHEKVKEGYLQILRDNKERFRKIDVKDTIEETFEEIKKIVDDFLGKMIKK